MGLPGPEQVPDMPDLKLNYAALYYRELHELKMAIHIASLKASRTGDYSDWLNSLQILWLNLEPVLKIRNTETRVEEVNRKLTELTKTLFDYNSLRQRPQNRLVMEKTKETRAKIRTELIDVNKEIIALMNIRKLLIPQQDVRDGFTRMESQYGLIKNIKNRKW